MGKKFRILNESINYFSFSVDNVKWKETVEDEVFGDGSEVNNIDVRTDEVEGGSDSDSDDGATTFDA